MSEALEDSVDTLPGIIKSLAQQVSSREAQLRNERAKFLEELSAMKQQHAVIRAERDHSLRLVEEVELQRNRLEEDLRKVRATWSLEMDAVRVRAERELEEEKAFYAKVKADFDREKGELEKKVELLEQTVNHQADVLAQARREAADCKAHHVTVAEETRRQSQECLNQLSRMADRLGVLARERHQSDAGSSPTIAPSVSPNKPSSAHQISPSKPRRQPDVFLPNALHHSPASAFADHHQSSDNVIATNSGASREGGHSAPSRHRRMPETAVETERHQFSLQGMQKQISPGKGGPSSASKSQPPKASSGSTLPPDRVIITARYEIKQEEDSPDHLPISTESPGNKRPRPRAEVESEEEGRVAAPKRRRSMRKSSIKYIEDEDEEAEDHDGEEDDEEEVRQKVNVPVDIWDDEERDDYDEMAIGAEDNHKEIYGYRRVNVRQVNERPRTPPQRAQQFPNSTGSSGARRKAGPAAATAKNGRPAATRTRQ